MGFRFKQFKVEDDRSTMKVGTDAVLLGAWADAGSAKNMLEIGTGSGVIALMLAQRSETKIEAIDIDKNSIEQAHENFQNSPWANRLNAIDSSLKDFCKSSSEKFEVIVSNPPFFNNSLTSPKQKKTRSKHTGELSYEDLLHGIVHFLAPNGNVFLILPHTESKIFVKLAQQNHLYVNKELLIRPKKEKAANRVLMELSFRETEKESTEIYLREPDNSFSKAYSDLCQDYYLDK